MKKSVSDLIMEYFRAHPKQDLEHGPVVDWVEEQYFALTGKNHEIPGELSESFTSKEN
jgi:hypothetical protein